MAKGNGGTRTSRTTGGFVDTLASYEKNGGQTGSRPFKDYLRSKGFSEDEINEAWQVFYDHSDNSSARQEKADELLYNAMNGGNSRVEKALKAIATAHEELYQYNKSHSGEQITGYEYDEQVIYRAGGRKNVEPWTTNYDTALRFSQNDGLDITETTVGELKKSYYLVGGKYFMSGMTSDSELTFVKKKR